MKLFNVTIETEIVVVAETAADAERIGERKLRDIDPFDFDTHARPMAYLPGTWEPQDIPYGHRDPADPNRSIAGWRTVLGTEPPQTPPPEPIPKMIIPWGPGAGPIRTAEDLAAYLARREPPKE